VAVRVGQLGDPRSRGLGLGSSGSVRSGFGVQDAAMSRNGQVPQVDGGADDVGGVQSGQFGGVQRTEQPLGPWDSSLRCPGGSAAITSSRVAVVAAGLGSAVQMRAGHSVVGVPGCGAWSRYRQSAPSRPEHRPARRPARVARLRRDRRGLEAGNPWWSCQMRSYPGEFGRAGCRLRVRRPGRGGEHVGQVDIGAAGHRG